MPTPDAHIPVLHERVLDPLAPQPGETAIDCTAGLGGHAAAIAQRVGLEGRVIINDLDASNLERASDRVASEAPGVPIVPWQGNFAETPRKAREAGITAHVVLADLGFASPHVDDPDRGFSFKRDGPLDMRYDRTRGESAADLVNRLPEPELAEIIRRFGEDRNANRIAAKIAREREASPMTSTMALARVVHAAVGGPNPRERIDPATRTFQALRIAVNDELGSLSALLESVTRAAAQIATGAGVWLAPGARVGIISFHSLEDRLVKQAFASVKQRRLGTVLTPSPITGDDTEVQQNPRARSAKLRVVRLGGTTPAGQR
ncbi:MAG: 16S rRNA (cytosine(1402)-N(4))-methyltransferase RsmH [Planctomycetota bacterium]